MAADNVKTLGSRAPVAMVLIWLSRFSPAKIDFAGCMTDTYCCSFHPHLVFYSVLFSPVSPTIKEMARLAKDFDPLLILRILTLPHKYIYTMRTHRITVDVINWLIVIQGLYHLFSRRELQSVPQIYIYIWINNMVFIGLMKQPWTIWVCGAFTSINVMI